MSRKQDELLKLLQTGRKLSKQEILREIGAWNSGDLVMKLRRAGNNIKTEMVTKDENIYAVYYLVPKEEVFQLTA